MTLDVLNESGRDLPPGAHDLLEAVAAAALSAGGGPCAGDVHADLTLVDNARMQELNRMYFGVDAPTDVISFSLFENGPGEPEPPIHGAGLPTLLGDVVVSVDQAATQAGEAGHPLLAELALLVAHGILHLLGQGDETPGQRSEMRRLEGKALRAVGLPVCLPSEYDV
jgi:probable rRNA maturation factor